MLIVLLLSLAPIPAAGQECPRSTRLEHLFLVETADVRSAGELSAGYVAGRAQNGTDYNLFQGDLRLGWRGRWQLYANWDENRIIHGEIDHAVTFGIGRALLCRPGAPLLRLDAGFHHDGGDGAEFGLHAGQRAGGIGWQLGLRHTRVTDVTRYSAALILDRPWFAAALEGSAEDTPTGQDEWISLGLFPVAGERFQLGFALARGRGASEGRRHLLLRMAARF